MRKFLINLKRLSIITIIAGMVIGIILIVKPNEAVSIVSILCGATIILLGAGAWVSYFAKFRSTLLAVLGTMAVVAGIVICVNYESIISAVIFLFGLFIIISGVVDLVSAIEARRNDLKSWILTLFSSAAIIILGLIVVVNPFDSIVLLTRLLGVGLVVYAVGDLISFIQINRIAKLTTVNEKDVDEIIIDEDDIE